MTDQTIEPLEAYLVRIKPIATSTSKDWFPVILAGSAFLVVAAGMLSILILPGWVAAHKGTREMASLFGRNPMSVMMIVWVSLLIAYPTTMSLTFVRRPYYIWACGLFGIWFFVLIVWALGCMTLCGAFGDKCVR